MQGCRTGCAEKDRSPPGYAPALPVIRAAGAGNLGVGKRVSGFPWAARQSNPALLVGTTGGMTCVLVQLGIFVNVHAPSRSRYAILECFL